MVVALVSYAFNASICVTDGARNVSWMVTRVTRTKSAKVTCSHSGNEELVEGLHAPLWSPQLGATSGAPVAAHACWLVEKLHEAEYWLDAVASVAQPHVHGACGGSGGKPGGEGEKGGEGGGEGKGGGGEGDGGGGGDGAAAALRTMSAAERR